MRSNKKDFSLWRQRRREYLQSGLSRKAFCERHSIKMTTLDYWFARLRETEKTKGFVELKPESAGKPHTPLAVVVADKYRVEIADGFDHGLFAELLAVLGRLA
jgi:hypothetical protein